MNPDPTDEMEALDHRRELPLEVAAREARRLARRTERLARQARLRAKKADAALAAFRLEAGEQFRGCGAYREPDGLHAFLERVEDWMGLDVDVYVKHERLVRRFEERHGRPMGRETGARAHRWMETLSDEVEAAERRLQGHARGTR